jgi:hypothetical protein
MCYLYKGISINNKRNSRTRRVKKEKKLMEFFNFLKRMDKFLFLKEECLKSNIKLEQSQFYFLFFFFIFRLQ